MFVADVILVVLGFVALVFASVNDVRTREVPDWLSYGLIVSGFGVRVFHSLVFSDIWYLLYGLIGFGVMLVIGLVMYYAKQWGGGDAKLVMGLGVAFASVFEGFSFLVGFWMNVLIFGALYGLAWSVYLALRNRKAFVKSLSRLLHERGNMRFVSLALVFAVVVSIFLIHVDYIKFAVSLAALSFIGYSYVSVFVRAVEDSCMYKWVPVSMLTEGDWVAKPVYVKGKLVCGPKDLGLEKHQIAVLKKGEVKKVFVKEGIPFVPSFLISAVVTFIFGNVLLRII